MHTVVAGHNGTMQKMDRDKMITGGKVQLVNHQRVTHHTTIPYPDQAVRPPRIPLPATMKLGSNVLTRQTVHVQRMNGKRTTVGY